MKFLLLLLISYNTYSQWHPSSIQYLNNKAVYYQSLKDPDLTTMWGGFQRSLTIPWTKGSVISIKSDLFKKGEFPSYLYQVSQKAPLIIFFPGIFGFYDSEVSKSTLKTLESLSAHILVIPNFLNHEYIAAGPNYLKQQAVQSLDLQPVEEALEYTINKIGKYNITAIHLIGESLGTTIASALYATNKTYSNLFEKGSLSLMCPTLELSTAISNLDKAILTSTTEKNKCSNFYNYPMMLYHFLFQKIPTDMSEKFKSCMRNYLYGRTFLDTANKSLKAYYQLKNISNSSLASTLSEFFAKYQPHFLELLTTKDNRTQLSTWISKAINNNRTQIRILSSENDFVNFSDKWKELLQKTQLKNNQLLLLPWGGHCAFLGLDGWSTILSTELKIKREL